MKNLYQSLIIALSLIFLQNCMTLKAIGSKSDQVTFNVPEIELKEDSIISKSAVDSLRFIGKLISINEEDDIIYLKSKTKKLDTLKSSQYINQPQKEMTSKSSKIAGALLMDVFLLTVAFVLFVNSIKFH